MPERLDRVQIALERERIEISWNAQQALLDQLGRLPSGEPIIRQFIAVGATRPVKLRRDERGTLLEVVRLWLKETASEDRLWPEMSRLHDALAYELMVPRSPTKHLRRARRPDVHTSSSASPRPHRDNDPHATADHACRRSDARA